MNAYLADIPGERSESPGDRSREASDVDGRISPATAKGAVDTADVVEIGDFGSPGRGITDNAAHGKRIEMIRTS